MMFVSFLNLVHNDLTSVYSLYTKTLLHLFFCSLSSFCPFILSEDPWNHGGEHPTIITSSQLYENTPQSANYKAPTFDLFEHQEAWEAAVNAFQSKLVELGEADASSRRFVWSDDFQVWLSGTNYSKADLDSCSGLYLEKCEPCNACNKNWPFENRDDLANAAVWWLEAPRWNTPFSWMNFSETLFADDSIDTSYEQLTGFAMNSEDSSAPIYFTFASFETVLDVLEDGHPNERIQTLLANANLALDAAEAAAPALSGYGMATSSSFGMMALASYLSTSSFENMVGSLVLAVIVILLITCNVRVTALSAVVLYSIISLVFAEMVIFGWKINLLEAIDISIAGGMSVDYLLHLVHSFNHQSGSADQKVRGALREMGVSVTSGLCTTLVACVALYLCDMLWFRLFGCFITMVVLSSFVSSMLGLMALLACFGANDKGHEAAADEVELARLEHESGKRQSGNEVRPF